MTTRRIWIARGVAAAADLLQLALLPLVLGGAASPVVDVIDVGVAVALTVLVGWHWSFLPTFVAELLPLFDLVPTWSAAVWWATRHGASPSKSPSPSHAEVVDTDGDVTRGA